ncbi:MAG: E3 ubiquitin-protein ligase hrd1 [Geoglossum simile]|nr:MAG: E3 ubiquitin-protein ligase hrd1 [Geoglossum simile]
MRWAAYAGTSTVLAAGVVIRAFQERANFYSAAVYLSQSNACLMILANLLLFCVAGTMFGLQRLLYGPLRPIEIEQLYEKAWFAITETCLAMTIFREEVGGWFLVMFVALLVGKVWGWIGEGRVEVLEQQPPANPRLFHARLSFSLFLSLTFDISVLNYAVKTVLRMARPNMMVMFAFEFAVLTITSTSTAARYALSLTESLIIKRQTQQRLEERRAELRAAREEARQGAETQNDSLTQESTATLAADLPDTDLVDEIDIDVPGWDEKGQWVFYLDLATDLIKLIVYLSFFTILLIFYGLPIHIMRDVFLTLRSFIKRIRDFLRYRRATRDMNDRYPDATAEEIGRGEVCIICREEMRPWQTNDDGRDGARPRQARRGASFMDERSRPKKLPCGHILHFSCLRSWLERQQNCPTCRRPVLATTRIQVRAGNQQAPNAVGNAVPHGLPQQHQNQHIAGHAEHADPAPGGDQLQMRGRFFNLGPLRIGFGVGRGDLFQDMAQQLQNGQPAPAADHQVRNNGRGMAFGFGLGRAQHPIHQQPAATPPSQEGLSNWQHQLQQVEQGIAAELAGLRLNADQLRVILMLRGELDRLRQQPQVPGVGLGMPYASIPGSTIQQQNPLQGAQLQDALFAQPNRAAMGSGHPGLPPGVTLPPGWTLLPLQRLAPGYGSALPIPTTGATTFRTHTGPTPTLVPTNGIPNGTDTHYHPVPPGPPAPERTMGSSSQTQQTVRDALGSLENSLALLDSISSELSSSRANQSIPGGSGNSNQTNFMTNGDARPNRNTLSRPPETPQPVTGTLSRGGAEMQEPVNSPNSQSAKGKEKVTEETLASESTGSSSTVVERVKEKGKGKAATVEDDAEELD